MVGCYGLSDGYHPSDFPGDRLVERIARVDVFWLNRVGALTQGAITELEIGPVGGPRPIRTVNLCREGPGVTIDGVLVRLTWDEAFGHERPWFECPICSQRCRHVFLRDQIGCRRCHRLDYSVRHLRRQTPGVGRVERLRRKLGDCDQRPFAPLPPRCRGRSQAYHDKLVAMIHDEEEKLLDHLGGIVHDLRRRVRVRNARHQW